jgi:hypothetical protein
MTPHIVMPGLDPGIHGVPRVLTPGLSANGAAWMAGSSPAMTSLGYFGSDHRYPELVQNNNR